MQNNCVLDLLIIYKLHWKVVFYYKSINESKYYILGLQVSFLPGSLIPDDQWVNVYRIIFILRFLC